MEVYEHLDPEMSNNGLFIVNGREVYAVKCNINQRVLVTKQLIAALVKRYVIARR